MAEEDSFWRNSRPVSKVEVQAISNVIHWGVISGCGKDTIPHFFSNCKPYRVGSANFSRTEDRACAMDLGMQNRKMISIEFLFGPPAATRWDRLQRCMRRARRLHVLCTWGQGVAEHMIEIESRKSSPSPSNLLDMKDGNGVKWCRKGLFRSS